MSGCCLKQRSIVWRLTREAHSSTFGRGWSGISSTSSAATHSTMREPASGVKDTLIQASFFGPSSFFSPSNFSMSPSVNPAGVSELVFADASSANVGFRLDFVRGHGGLAFNYEERSQGPA